MCEDNSGDLLETDVDESGKKTRSNDSSIREEMEGDKASLREELLPDWENN